MATLIEPNTRCVACGELHTMRETGNPRIGWRELYYDCPQTKKRYTQSYAFGHLSGPLDVRDTP